MKPLNVKNYGSIGHLSNSKLGSGDHFINHGQERILTEKPRDKNDLIIVSEKYDGSNVGIAKIDNKIYPLTRSGHKASESKFNQHLAFSDWVYSNIGLWIDILDNGERITGEWMMQAHGIKYDIKNNIDPVVFFDYFDKHNNRMTFDKLEDLKSLYDLKLPRVLHKGSSVSVDSLKEELYKCDSDFVPDEKPEGMVYRVERKGKVDFLAKWVRKDFQNGKYIIGVETPTYNTQT